MSRFRKLRDFFGRWSSGLGARRQVPIRTNVPLYYAACKDLAAWSAADAGLGGSVEIFDGSRLHPAADGMCTIHLTLQDSRRDRSPAEAAAAVLRAFRGLRVLLLVDIDGSRFVSALPHVNRGVREMCRNFTNSTGLTG
jgi:hypothetical protein